MTSRLPSNRRRSWNRRGVTLLEGMVSSFILVIGLVGVLNGIIYAARQNATANKMTRAGAIATQIRASLVSQGVARLDGSGGLFSTCDTGSPTNTYVDGMDSITGYTTCMRDIDTYDSGASAANKLMPGFSADDKALYKRVAIRMRDASGKTVGVSIVVSWNEITTRRFHHQYMSFYDTTKFKGLDL